MMPIYLQDATSYSVNTIDYIMPFQRTETQFNFSTSFL